MSNNHFIINVKPGEEATFSFTIRCVPDSIEIINNRFSTQEIADKICKANNVPFSLLAGKSQKNDIMFIRHMYYHVAHDIYRHALHPTGDAINRDHTSVINGCKTFKDLKDSKNISMLEVINKTQPYFPVQL